jgi:hypothetical protein
VLQTLLPIEAFYAAGAAGVTALAFLARGQRRLVTGRRERIVDSVREVFDTATFSTDGAGIPTIDGVYRKRRVKIDFIPDNMTVRRLPQLWVSVTALKPLAAPHQGVSVLVRPSGADFFSLTSSMHTHFDPPSGFPWECLVRGQSELARNTLMRMAPAAANILSDAKVKELAITDRGARVVYQLAEGRRGQHLLLRQCDFDEARLEPPLLERLIGDLDALAACFGQSLEMKS